MVRLRRTVNDHRHTGNRGKAVPLELFFDLVFVFAITQVSTLMAADPTWSGVVRGLAVLAVLWWAWVGYSWLASATDPEEGWVRLAFFAVMAAMFVVALATDEAFGASAVTFAVAYLVVRFLHLGVFLVLARTEPAFRRAVLTLAPSFVVAPLLLLAGAVLSGPARAVCWVAALVVDYAGPLLGGSRGWRINPSHFAERHGLIVIIALGEAIFAVGVAAEPGTGVSASLVAVAVVVVAIGGAWWWAYFDVVAIAAERKLHELDGADRNRMARDSYSYLHLFLVAGVVLVALGAKKTAADPTAVLKAVPAAALGGGAALYLATLSLLRWRNYGRPNVQRLVAAALAPVVVVPLARQWSGLAALVGLAVLAWAVVTFEAIRLADARHALRHAGEH
jgi:low temperature requirement protein LtrA